MAQNDHSEVYIIPPNFVKEAICCEKGMRNRPQKGEFFNESKDLRIVSTLLMTAGLAQTLTALIGNA